MRDEAGNMLNPDRTSTVSLFRAHETASRSVDDRIQEEKAQFRFVDTITGCQFHLMLLSTHCFRPCFHPDTATEPGNEASDSFQYSAHLQLVHELEKLCM